MHAAQPAGGENRDAGSRGEVRSRGDGRRPVPTLGREHGDVANADLHHRVALRNAPQRRAVQTDVRLAADDRNRGRHRPAGAHRCLDLAREAQVVGTRQTVADDRALQRNDRPSSGQRVRDFGVDMHGLHPTWPGTWCDPTIDPLPRNGRFGGRRIHRSNYRVRVSRGR
jgi:hypothetical protein